jgi:cation/acetate symporter
VILSVLALGGVALAVLAIGTRAGQISRTTSDLLVASRTVPPWWNAAAVAGEYISTSSFLGIPGLAMQIGTIALWQPVGFGLGYLGLLVFVAAPMRRSGSYTIGDLAEVRFRSPRLRKLTPQLKGAGLTIAFVSGAPYWVGVAGVATLVALLVALGGMRGITSVQAFQFFVKLFAISASAIALLVYLGGPPHRRELFGSRIPEAPAAGLRVSITQPTRVTFPEATSYVIAGQRRHATAGQHAVLAVGTLVLPGGAGVPVADGIAAQTGEQWSSPVSAAGGPNQVFIYSLLLGTCLGTLGIPNILIRLFTNPNGVAARRTTVWILVMLGIFWITPFIYSMLGRALTPWLYVTGNTDSAVLEVPHAAWPGLGGRLLSALVAAGAFTAFTAAASGLLVAMAGTLGYDIWPRLPVLRSYGESDHRKRFRASAAVAMAVSAVIALFLQRFDISTVVGAAFGIAASTFCPLLLLGIWWRRLTAAAAALGMVIGATLSTVALVLWLALSPSLGTVAGALLAQPALVTVPIAFLAMIGWSLLSPVEPVNEASMLALHRPELAELVPQP